MPVSDVRYPIARRDDVVDDFYGTKVADPYRWIEVAEQNPDLDEWLSSQRALCDDWFAARADRDRWRSTQSDSLPGDISPPIVRGSRHFFLRREVDEPHARFLMRDADGVDCVVFDPMAQDSTGLTTLEVMSVSPDGSRVVVGTSTGGAEDTAIRVLDVLSGETIDGPIERTRYTPIGWLPDSNQFFYVRRLTPEPFNRRVWRHTIGRPIAEDELIFGEGRDPSTYYSLDVSSDGLWLVIGASMPGNDLYIVDLDGDQIVRPIIEGLNARTTGSVIRGQLYLHTSLDAPKRRLVVADPRDPGPDKWLDVVPESTGVLTVAKPTDAGIVIAREEHAVTTVSVRDPVTACERVIAMPGAGSAQVMTQLDHGVNAWVLYTDFVTPPRVFHLAVDSGELTRWATAPGTPPAASGVSVEQHALVSLDGVEIRMFVIAKEVAERRPRPTILYGYGGFGVSMSPTYSSFIHAWVEAGGVYAVANLRGGAEEGEEWHQAGMRERKQNVFNDFIAAARYLKADGWTTTEQLGAYGGSNGGLLVGAALTQWPDEMAAVVCSAPLLDMVRYERFGLGRTWTAEYGSVEKPNEFRWLYAYSPLHRVRKGVPYPSVLFTSFENDTRTDVMHARKMCAALQHATSSPANAKPILLHSNSDVGHSFRSTSQSLDHGSDQLTYFAHQLGLNLPRGDDR